MMPSAAKLATWAVVAGAIAAIVVLQPLAVYSLALAAFGLPHVASEMRFIDRRFGRELRGPLLTRIVPGVAALICVRLCGMKHWLTPEVEAPTELAGLGVLALLALKGCAVQSLVALGIGSVLIVGAVLSPLEALVCVAILHNLTPLGFFWLTAPRNRRLPVMSLAAAGLVALPLFIATGLPRRLLQPLRLAAMIDPIHAGPLDRDLFVYVPSSLLESVHAVDLFSASVMAQCAHYASVIIFLPKMLSKSLRPATGLVPWPSRTVFSGLCIAVGVFSVCRFSANFTDARTLYGLLAAAHVWIEIPVLILTLSARDQPASQRPAAKEAPLASADTRAA